MNTSRNVCRILLLSAAIIATPAWLVGCANSGATATVRKAEQLVAAYPNGKDKLASRMEAEPEAPAEGPEPRPPGLGPGLQRADTSKEHLFELYAGQQLIIEKLEGNAGSRPSKLRPGGGPSEEGPPSALPENISRDDLLRILGQQQKLITELTNRNAKPKHTVFR